MSGAEFVSILSVAALSSVGHCVGMCGGFAIGGLMAVLGVALIRRGAVLNFIEKNAFLSKILNEKMKAAISKNSVLGFLTLGFLNGLLPCGVVYYFLALAVASGSGAKGAAIAATFGAVSFFAMSFYALVLKAVSEKFKKHALNLSGAAIIIYGIYLSFIGFTASNG